MPGVPDPSSSLVRLPRAADPAPRLREIPGGYDIDRWPLCVPRAASESLESWLQRLAARYGLHARDVLMGLRLQDHPQQRPDLFQLFSTSQGADAAQKIGLQPRDLTVRDPLAAALFGTRDRHRREFLGRRGAPRPRESRWCPRCLQETGAWQDSWRDPMHLYCVEHQLVLVTRCPSCHAVPFASTAWSTSMLDPTWCPDFTDTSSVSRYRERCGTSFLHAEQQPADQSDMDNQELLFKLAALAHHEPTTIVEACGLSGQALTAYEAALEIVTYLVGTLDLRIDPDSEEHLAYACRVAAQFLTAPNPRTALAYAARHRAFRDVGSIPHGPRSKVFAERRNPLLIAVSLNDLNEHPERATLDLELRFRLGSDRPRYPDSWQDHDRIMHPSDAPAGLPLSSIPQLIWPTALELPDADGLGLDTPVGRSFTSLCLARYGTDRPARVLATALGLPGWTAPSFRQHWQALRDTGRWREYLRALQQLFDRLHEHPPPVDYMQRRLQGQEPFHLLEIGDQVKQEVAHQVLEALKRDKGLLYTAAPESIIRRTIWAAYTGGEADYAPGAYGIRRRNRRPANPLRPEDVARVWPADAPLQPAPLWWAPP